MNFPTDKNGKPLDVGMVVRYGGTFSEVEEGTIDLIVVETMFGAKGVVVRTTVTLQIEGRYGYEQVSPGEVELVVPVYA